MTGEARPDFPRRVRSFVRRPGRLTSAQQRALDERLPRYAVDVDLTDLRAAFDRPAPLVVEIGFGNGEALAWMAAREPEKNFVGIEVHEPGVGRLVRQLDDQGLGNVRIAMRDAVEVLSGQVPSASLAQVRVYFPDPWPKKRHHKRRIVQPAFVEGIAERLEPGGILHLATDWAPYAQWMVEVAEGCERLENLGDPWSERPAWRPQTHFERRGLGRGHEIFDLVYRRGC
ncbi:tRNA (guanosine(46)-N7)-methyltransferase TrmB [Wenzhouxiangella limi]|uniref:tRNA (guanine-N(7)-)-methyltransferase n=1 Tax=Wenzhouxiangella limi TaxID=2707351 RepID=A0A845V427_9GAMM|nr:tRNA (guanosine(46)-N7)-methyltransferase TrmB [Wenzhouxiangella limi]NDY95946.1 tRNA (guanosine(46)-N7)-methyltransferase TrmB [Wenzhouxiangella limi]